MGKPITEQDGADALRAAFWLYLAFVVYGSLLPFQFRDLVPGEAWLRFTQIPYLQLDMRARADWVANLVLYAPLGFLARAVLSGRPGGGRQIASGTAAVFSVALCLAVALAVEFLQVYAPPRTVSINDLLAEAVGASVGVGAFHLLGSRLLGLLRHVTFGGVATVRAAALLYGAAYLTLSLFPFDFVVGGGELAAKLAAVDSYGLLTARGCTSVLRCVAKFAAEVIAVVPLGILLGIHARRGSGLGLGSALLFGLMLGVLIEGAQLLLVSGVTQGLSVLTRTVGVAAGFVGACSFSISGLAKVRGHSRLLLLLAAVPYLVLLAGVNSWFSAAWVGWDRAAAELSRVHWTPFYYHYYTSEAAAFASLLAVTAMYAPIGAAYWVWHWAGRTGKGSAVVAGVIAAGLAAVVETGKLFVGSRPDPTDVWIGFAAAAGAFIALNIVTGRSWLGTAARLSAGAGRIGRKPPSSMRTLAVVTAGVGMAWLVLQWPVAPVPVLLGLLTYGAILWLHPAAWALALPLLLPLLDFSVWSGQLFFDEFDLVVLTSLIVAGLRAPQLPGNQRRDPLLGLLLGLLTVSYGIAMARGVWPLARLDVNAFSSYFSHFNALRVAKGFVFALALGWLMGRWWRAEPQRMESRWYAGLSIGLLGFACAVLWERYLFPGVFDFNEPYRVSGTFPTLHTGGPQVETYAVLTLPLAAIWAWNMVPRWRYAALALVVALGTYVVWVSYSRAGYAALLVAALVMLGGGLLRSLRFGAVRRAAAVGLAVAIVGAGTLLSAGGGYLNERLQHSQADLERRLEHWRLSLNLMPSDWSSVLFGAGLGRFPEAYLLRNPHGSVPGNYGYVDEGDNRYLRLGSGDSLYFGQHVDLQPNHRYRLDFDVRAPGSGVLGIHLCEKYITQSYHCRNLRWTPPEGRSGWQHVRMQIESGDLPATDGRQRPVELAFSATGGEGVFDLDNITFGRPNLIRNGDFDRGWVGWFFTTDDMWPWRVENVWLQFYFEHGWFGVLVLALLVLLHGTRLLRAAGGGDGVSLALLASLAGWLTIGTFSSVMDDPKLALWFYLLLFYGQMRLAHGYALTPPRRDASV